MSKEPWFVNMCHGFNADLPPDFGYVADFTGKPATPDRISVRGDTSTAERVAWLFDGIQDIVIEQTGKTWPRCPIHGTHPVEATKAGWECPDITASPRLYTYGTLSGLVPPPEPVLEDGHIRWVSERRGRGLIAHHEGDLIFREDHIRVEGLWRRELAEGARVEYAVSERRHWKLREVEWVQRVE